MRHVFIYSNQAYYWMDIQPHLGCEEEILVQSVAEDGGVNWEFGLRWHGRHQPGGPTLRVEIFQDAFAAFAEARSLFELMATMASSNPTPSAVITNLKACGFKDATQREYPSA